MKNYTYYFELKNLLVQFMAALDDCVIKRYDNNRVAQEEVAVRVVYSPKSRTIHNLVNKQQNMELPVISVSLGGVQRVANRQHNKIDGPTYHQDNIRFPLQPIPVNITVNVSILTKFQTDMDQIVSNMIPYFDPYIIISWKHPEMTQEIRSKVEWSGSLSYNYPNDLQATQAYRQAVDTSFTVEGWLFKKSEPSTTGIIHTIDMDFIGVKDLAEIEKDYYDPTEYDKIVINGYPVVTDVVPIYIETNKENTVYLNGTMLDKTTDVYMSGALLDYTEDDFIDTFVTDSVLSGANPPFYGKVITNFDKIGESLLVTVPPIENVGLLDIICSNPAGYGGVVKNANQFNLWKYGIIVYQAVNATGDNVVFDATSVDNPTSTLIYDRMVAVTLNNNPTNHQNYVPLYIEETESGGSDTVTIEQDLETLDMVAGTLKYIELIIDGNVYYTPMYRKTTSDIVIGFGALRLEGKVVDVYDVLSSVGYIKFNLNGVRCRLMLYSAE